MIVLTSETIPDPLSERAAVAVRTAQCFSWRIPDESTAAETFGGATFWGLDHSSRVIRASRRGAKPG